jgi:bacitracin transport system permease protein
MKFRKSKIAILGFLFALIMPIYAVVQGSINQIAYTMDFMRWVINGMISMVMMLSIISGIVITVLVQREYQDNALVNVLTSPVSRKRFIFAKLTAWFLWYIFALVGIIVVYVFGSRFIFTEIFSLDRTTTIIQYFGVQGLLGFIAFIPLLLVTIIQRKIFYPSIILTIILALVMLEGGDIAAGGERFSLANIIPWQAVTIISYGVSMPYKAIGLASIFTSGIIGLALSLYTFSKQDQ